MLLDQLLSRHTAVDRFSNVEIRQQLNIYTDFMEQTEFRKTNGRLACHKISVFYGT
jgi:hypothetical protein